MRIIALVLGTAFSLQSYAESGDCEAELASIFQGAERNGNKFEVVESAENYAVMKVDYGSGKTNSTAGLYAFAGFNCVARNAGKLYFLPLKEWVNDHGERLYQIGLANFRDIHIDAKYGIDVSEKPIPNNWISVTKNTGFW